MLNRILGFFGRLSYYLRHLIVLLFIALFIGAGYLQSLATISYSYADYNKVIEIFPEDDTLVVVYENKDEAVIKDIITILSENEHVTSIQAYANTLGMEMSTAELAAVAGIDESFIKTLFYIKENGVATNGMSFITFINFIASDAFLGNEMLAGMIDDATKAQLIQTKTLVNTIASGAQLDAATLAAMFGMDSRTVSGIFFMLGVQTMSPDSFVNTMLGMAMQNPNAVAPEQLAGLQQMAALSAMAKNPAPMTPGELVMAFSAQSEAFNESTVTLICIMYDSMAFDATGKTLTLYDFFGFISDYILPDETFAPFFDEATKAQMLGAKETMEDGKAQLVGSEHSRMIITIDYALESEQMYDFYTSLEDELNTRLEGEYQLVGNSAMSNELSKTFRKEYLTISIVTAIAIFLVVLMTFKRVAIPAILVGVIECAVFITMSVMTVTNTSMYFIAVIIVQCVLMGAMVDYGILLTNYYIEVRKDHTVKEALPEVLRRSIRAIATSATILVVVTLICSFFMSGAVASILSTICIGSFSALMLVIFVLPSLLAVFDRFVTEA